MKLSDRQYTLYSTTHEETSEALMEIVRYYYGNRMRIYYSLNLESIILAREEWLNVGQKCIFLPWDKARISPLELDTLLAMERL